MEFALNALPDWSREWFSIPLGLVMYFAWSLALYMIAKRTGTPNAWFAWIPILNVVLMINVAGMSWINIIWLLIPCVNFFFSLYVWWKVAERCGKPGILGILMWIPLVNLLVAFYLAGGE